MAKTHGVIEAGKGNHTQVTIYRVGATGEKVAQMGPVAKVTEKTADIRLSAGGTRAAQVVGDSTGARDAIVMAAAEWADKRRSRKVWDIDFACALGYPVNPEGAADFRRDYNLPTPSEPWPTKPEQNPVTGPLVDKSGVPKRSASD